MADGDPSGSVEVAGLLAANDLLPARHCAWLLQPLIDLGPFQAGPLYSRAIEHYWAACEARDMPRFALQRILPHGFRALMLREAGRTELLVDDPRALPAQLRTPRWQALCERIDAWSDLTDEERCRLALLLHGLCFFELVVALVPAHPWPLRDWSPAAVELLYWRESASYMVRMPRSFADYGAADLSTLEAIATQSPQSPQAAFNAAVKCFVHRAKVGAGAAELEPLAHVMEHRLEGVCAAVDRFMAGLLTSRFHRALAFLPMRRGDHTAVVRQMDLAEEHARALQPATPAERLMQQENLHPVLESRSKEALWLGDRELALVRAHAVVELDCHDPKSWLELGHLQMAAQRWVDAAESFAAAARLGPPAGAIAHHMAGVCCRKLGQDMLAALFFQQALELDPMGISPRVQIASFPDAPEFEALREWSAHRFDA